MTYSLVSRVWLSWSAEQQLLVVEDLREEASYGWESAKKAQVEAEKTNA